MSKAPSENKPQNTDVRDLLKQCQKRHQYSSLDKIPDNVLLADLLKNTRLYSEVDGFIKTVGSSPKQLLKELGVISAAASAEPVVSWVQNTWPGSLLELFLCLTQSPDTRLRELFKGEAWTPAKLQESEKTVEKAQLLG